MVRLVIKLIAAFTLAGAGVAMTLYADADDAPGGMLIGMLVVIGAIVLAARAVSVER